MKDVWSVWPMSSVYVDIVGEGMRDDWLTWNAGVIPNIQVFVRIHSTDLQTYFHWSLHTYLVFTCWYVILADNISLSSASYEYMLMYPIRNSQKLLMVTWVRLLYHHQGLGLRTVLTFLVWTHHIQMCRAGCDGLMSPHDGTLTMCVKIIPTPAPGDNIKTR